MSVIDDNLPLLRSIENEARQDIGHVSLIAELAVPVVQAKNALRLHVMAHRHWGHAEGRRFNQSYPVSLVVGLVDIAQRLYVDGGLWPYINAELKSVGLRNDLDQMTQTAFREVFTDTLRRYGLRTVGEGNELVDTAAMHAGIPTACLPDWYDLTRRARLSVGDSPAAMTEWALRNRNRPSMGNIAQPVKRMLEAGPEFAQDLFERAAELVDHMLEACGPGELKEIAALEPDDGIEHDAAQMSKAVGLSPRWTVMAARYLGTGQSVRRAGSTTSPVQNAQPQVFLDFAEGRVALRLPAILGAQSPVQWQVSMGAETVAATADLDMSGTQLASRPVSLPIHHPLPSVGILAGQHRLEVTLWPSGGLAAFFDLGGRLSPQTGGVTTPGPKWVLMPEDAQLEVAGSTRDPKALDDPPSGWFGWSLRRYDLSPHEVVAVIRGNDRHEIRVRGGQSPIFMPSDPVPGARHFGWPIMSERPKVQLPADSGMWRVTVTRRGDHQPLWDREVAGGQVIAPLDGLYGLAGVFQLRVRGALGRGITEQFSLVDGLQFLCQPPARTLGADGRLNATTVRPGASVGINVAPATVGIEQDASFADFTATSKDGPAFAIRYYAPATLVALSDAQGIPRWGPRPVRIDPADLDELQWLHLRLPSMHSEPTLHAVHGRDIVQTLEPQKSLGSLRYSLTALGDTARKYPELRLILEDQQQIGLVRARPKIAAMEVSPGGEFLEFTVTAGSLDELEIWSWLADAPWREPVLLEPHQDRAALPETYRNAGPLHVHERPADPWLPQDPPAPTVRKTLVSAPGSPDLSATEQRVCAIAAGDTGVPLHAADAEVALDALNSRPWLKHSNPPDAAKRLTHAMSGIDSSLLLALAARSNPLEQQEQDLVRTHLYYRAPILSDWETSELRRSSTALAAVFTAQSVRHAQPSETGSDDDAVEATDSWLAETTREFGDSYLTMLDRGVDPSAGIGRFDNQSVMLEFMPPTQMRLIIGAMGLVPRGLLDPDTRIRRSAELAERFRGPEAVALPRLQRHMPLLHSLVGASPAARLWEGVEELQPDGDVRPHHWAPPFARAAALLARALPRCEGHPEFPTSIHSAVANVAYAAPLLFLSELIRAEALLGNPEIDPQTELAQPQGVTP